MIIVIWMAIIGGILLIAFIIGAIGSLCTHSRRDLVPGLLFGLPTVLLSLPVLVFCAQSWALVFSAFAVLPLSLGLLDICRALHTGDKRGDLVSGAIICGGLFLFGFVLYKYPEVTQMMFSHILPAPRG
jgi:hypothetical protein